MCERIVCIDDLLEEIAHFRPPKFRIRLYVREKIHDEFMDFLGGKGFNPDFKAGDISYRWPKMVAIAAIMYRNRYQVDLYRKENSDPDVTAMKFMDKRRNDRLYCREVISDFSKYVVICEIHDKKNFKNKHKEYNIIKRVGKYEFEVFT